MTPEATLHLAVALEPGGWHPAARSAHDPAHESVDHWTGLVREAERGLLDFVTFEDGLAPGGPAQGRLDPLLVAAAAAARTRHIGLVPTVLLSLTQPVHTATAIATLDRLSGGRAGLRPRVTGRRADLALLGRDDPAAYDQPDLTAPAFLAAMDARFDEAAEHVEAVRDLWDGHTDHAGRWYRVQGALPAPAPPLPPPITALAHVSTPYRFAARTSDVVYVTPRDRAEAEAAIEEIRAFQESAGRAAETLHVFADLLVHLDPVPGEARDRHARLEGRVGGASPSDAFTFTGTPADLAELLADWRRAGLSGFRLRPATVPHDLTEITRGLVPVLQRAGLFRKQYDAATLRGHLRLDARS